MEQASTDNHTNKSQSHQQPLLSGGQGPSNILPHGEQQQQPVRLPAGQTHANATSSNGNADQHGGLSQEDITAGGLMGNPYPSISAPHQQQASHQAQRQSQPEQQQRRQQQRQQQHEDEQKKNLPTFMDGGMTGRQNQPKRVAQGPAASVHPTGKPRLGCVETDPKKAFGLIGILNTIRFGEPSLNSFTLGMDLSTLGLNLNSAESLHTSFSSPWFEDADKDKTAHVEPEFILPTSYFTQPLQFKGAHLQKFSIETLFYIFYNMPGDMLQAIAAVELYRRNYFYHSELKWWFEKSDDPSKASWSYFDPAEWKKRYYWESLDESLFLKESEVTNLSHIDMSTIPNFQDMQQYIDRDEPLRQ